MKNNRERYKAAFSKLHTSVSPDVLTGPDSKNALDSGTALHRRRRLRKPLAVCLAAATLFLFAATVAYAMTGESPAQFFKSFFNSAEPSVSDEIAGTYVAVTDQEVVYENMNITFKGYSYTENILLAKFEITSLDGAKLDTDGKVRRLFFATMSSGAVETDWKQSENGAVDVTSRVSMAGQDKGEIDGEADKLFVCDRDKGTFSPVASFVIGAPSEITQITFDDVELPQCSRVALSGMRMQLDFDASVTDEEESPVQTIALEMKNGTAMELYDRENGTGEDSITADTLFKWNMDEGSSLTIGFSGFLEVGEVKAIVINGKTVIETSR